MAWNLTICSPPSLLRLSTKSRGEVQMLGVASPQMSPTSVIRDEVDQGGNILAGSPKRQFYSAFDQQQDEVVLEDEVNVIEGSVVEGGGSITTTLSINGKKRRLTGEQVRYLEESFEAENKLEPERKLQIARQLGLQPRQVAVWFQNRRARSKSKQLERDFTLLKAKYDAVLGENRKLHAEVVRLTSLLQGNDSEGNAAHITGCRNTTSMASVGVKIELEVSTTATSPPANINNTTLHVNELTSNQCNILESPKSEVLDSLTPPPLMNTSNGTTPTSMAVPLPLISAAVLAAAAKAEASSNVVDALASTTSTTILSSTATTSTTPTTAATSTPTPTPDAAAADFVIANMTTATATSTSTSNPLLVQQLSLCKLEGGCLTEDYNLIFAQWPDTNVTGTPHHLNLQPLHHADNNLFIAQYWDEPNIMLDPWFE